ncbi:MAG: phosphohydrolase [Proteobacteria bacterium]|nr:phosphohydrolase [Pseudomonadota bacterium]
MPTDRSAPPPPSRSRDALDKADWSYVEAPSLEAFTAADWAVLNAQRDDFYRRRQAADVLRMLAASADDPTFGYQVNNFRHCLQAATRAQQDGLDEETVVVCLLHDIGFVACPSNHGAFAAALLGPYVSAANEWMLAHHQVFQQVHLLTYPGNDPSAREHWRGHPAFEWTARFVARYDQDMISPDAAMLPLAAFEPMVQRLFERPPRPMPLD